MLRRLAQAEGRKQTKQKAAVGARIEVDAVGMAIVRYAWAPRYVILRHTVRRRVEVVQASTPHPTTSCGRTAHSEQRPDGLQEAD